MSEKNHKGKDIDAAAFLETVRELHTPDEESEMSEQNGGWVKKYLDEFDEGERMEQAFGLISSLAVGYDGYSEEKGLRSLIDEMAEVARFGIKMLAERDKEGRDVF